METTSSENPAAIAPSLPASARSMGATLGAALGLAAIAGLYVLSSLPEVEAVLRVRFILGPDGPASVLGTPVLAWAVAPVAAAVAGWVSAPMALGGQRWAGAQMGYVTYGVAIAIAPIAVYAVPSLTMFAPSDVVELVEGASAIVTMCVMLALLAGALLAPLLVICAGAGALWAAMYRFVMRVSPVPAQAGPAAASRGKIMGVIAVGLALLWLAGASLFGGGLFGGGDFVD